MIPLRQQGIPTTNGRVFEGLGQDHPLLLERCPACWRQFEVGDRTTLVPIGPGDDPDEQAKAKAGRWHTGMSVAVHATCAGVE